MPVKPILPTASAETINLMSRFITKRNILIVIAIFVVLGIISAVLSNYFSKRSFTPPEKLHFNSNEEARAYYQNLADAYKKDTYGDVTPEGTLALLITALEGKN